MNPKKSKIIDDESENNNSINNDKLELNETLKENRNDLNENTVLKQSSNSKSEKSQLNEKNERINESSNKKSSNVKENKTEEKVSIKNALKSKFAACTIESNDKKDLVKNNNNNNNTPMLNKKRIVETEKKTQIKYKSDESSSVSESSFYTEEISSFKKSKQHNKTKDVKEQKAVKEVKEKTVKEIKKPEIKQIKTEIKNKTVKTNNSAKKEENNYNKQPLRATVSSNDNNYNLKMSDKESIVYEILCRWWYISGSEWYKINEPIENILERNNLREVKLSNWKTEDNIVNGKKKCIQLKAFPYVFFDCDDNLHDFRNKENIPSYNNYIKKVRKF